MHTPRERYYMYEQAHLLTRAFRKFIDNLQLLHLDSNQMLVYKEIHCEKIMFRLLLPI